MAKAIYWTNFTDTERWKLRERTGLDTPVVLAVNDGYYVVGYLTIVANALSIPPGEYARKCETQIDWRGSAQAVDHVV